MFRLKAKKKERYEKRKRENKLSSASVMTVRNQKKFRKNRNY